MKRKPLFAMTIIFIMLALTGFALPASAQASFEELPDSDLFTSGSSDLEAPPAVLPPDENLLQPEAAAEPAEAALLPSEIPASAEEGFILDEDTDAAPDEILVEDFTSQEEEGLTAQVGQAVDEEDPAAESTLLPDSSNPEDVFTSLEGTSPAEMKLASKGAAKYMEVYTYSDSAFQPFAGVSIPHQPSDFYAEELDDDYSCDVKYIQWYCHENGKKTKETGSVFSEGKTYSLVIGLSDPEEWLAPGDLDLTVGGWLSGVFKQTRSSGGIRYFQSPTFTVKIGILTISVDQSLMLYSGWPVPYSPTLFHTQYPDITVSQVLWQRYEGSSLIPVTSGNFTGGDWYLTLSFYDPNNRLYSGDIRIRMPYDGENEREGTWETLEPTGKTRRYRCLLTVDSLDGSWGNNASYHYDPFTTVLTLTGTGELEDAYLNDARPWDTYQDKITRITIDSGVTAIGDNLFRGLNRVTQVDLPDGLTHIGSNAFEYCPIEEISFPSSLRYIGGSTFSWSSLVTVAFPKKMEDICSDAFSHSTSLKKVTIRSAKTFVGSDAFADCSPKLVIHAPEGSPAETYARNAGISFMPYGSKKISLTGAKVANIGDKTYTGGAIKPSPKVTLKGTVLKKGTDYTLSYKNNKVPGTATITVNGTGNYTGTAIAYFKIIPKGTSVEKITVNGTKRMTVHWVNQPVQTSGYQIRYSRKKDFSSGVKYRAVTGAQRRYSTITGLYAKKTYYVQVRTFTVRDDTRYYSKWSAAASVKTK